MLQALRAFLFVGWITWSLVYDLIDNLLPLDLLVNPILLVLLVDQYLLEQVLGVDLEVLLLNLLHLGLLLFLFPLQINLLLFLPHSVINRPLYLVLSGVHDLSFFNLL